MLYFHDSYLEKRFIMNLRQIEFVVAVAEEHSFTRAAQRCSIVQSALSHQVARLELELGATLFDRSSRHVRLTHAGQAFLRQAYVTLEAARRIPDEVASAVGQVRGQLSLGVISAPGSIDMVALIANFHRRYPQVDIRLGQSGSEELLDRLRGGRLDAAVVGLWPGEGVADLHHIKLGEERLVAVLPPGHPMAGDKRMTLQKLASLPLVDYPSESSARRQTDKAFAAAGITPRIHFEVNHVELIARFVAQGLAASLVPESVASGLQGVAQLPVHDAPRRVLYGVWAKSPTPATTAFVDLLRQRAGSPS